MQASKLAKIVPSSPNQPNISTLSMLRPLHSLYSSQPFVQHIVCIFLCYAQIWRYTRCKSLSLDLKTMKHALNMGHNVLSHSVSQTSCGGWLHLTLFQSVAIVGSIYTHYQGTANVNHFSWIWSPWNMRWIWVTMCRARVWARWAVGEDCILHSLNLELCCSILQTEHALLNTNITWAYIISTVFIVWSTFINIFNVTLLVSLSSQPNVK